MTIDPQSKDLVIAIVGTGVMGRGIAQIAAQAGVRVLLHDARPGAAQEARDGIAKTLSGLAERGKLGAEEAQAAVSRLDIAADLAALASARIVIEAIVERIEAKRELFAALERIVPANCILATNTSSLQVTAIAAGCRHPERVAGFHFFNPVPLMKVVEVVAGTLTDASVCDVLAGLARRCGHRPVRAADTPGFVVNHAGRGYGTEALRVLGEGVADAVEIDRILREAAGFRMGPFELLDLTALDVSHPVMESIYDQYYQEPRYRPSPITALRLAAGLLGRKTGRGFYTYVEGKPQVPAAPAAPAARPASVWVSGKALGPRLATLIGSLGVTPESSTTPSAQALCLIAPLGEDATTAALAEGLDPARTLAVDALLPFARRRTLMSTPVTRPDMRAAAWGLLASDGVPVSVIRDSAGFVAQRVLAQIVNIACDIAQQRIATPEDIDAAVTLGLGYPTGPLAWGDVLGADNVLAILDALLAFYGDPRYRASPWLRRRAMLGVSLTTPDS